MVFNDIKNSALTLYYLILRGILLLKVDNTLYALVSLFYLKFNKSIVNKIKHMKFYLRTFLNPFNFSILYIFSFFDKEGKNGFMEILFLFFSCWHLTMHDLSLCLHLIKKKQENLLYVI